MEKLEGWGRGGKNDFGYERVVCRVELMVWTGAMKQYGWYSCIGRIDDAGNGQQMLYRRFFHPENTEGSNTLVFYWGISRTEW